MHYICRGSFFTVVHTILWEASLSDSEKQLSFGYIFVLRWCSVQNFLEQILTQFSYGIEVGMKLFPIYILEAAGGHFK